MPLQAAAPHGMQSPRMKHIYAAPPGTITLPFLLSDWAMEKRHCLFPMLWRTSQQCTSKLLSTANIRTIATSLERTRSLLFKCLHICHIHTAQGWKEASPWEQTEQQAALPLSCRKTGLRQTSQCHHPRAATHPPATRCPHPLLI